MEKGVCPSWQELPREIGTGWGVPINNSKLEAGGWRLEATGRKLQAEG